MFFLFPQMASILSQNFGPNWLTKAFWEAISSAFLRQHEGHHLYENARERRWWELTPQHLQEWFLWASCSGVEAQTWPIPSTAHSILSHDDLRSTASVKDISNGLHYSLKPCSFPAPPTGCKYPSSSLCSVSFSCLQVTVAIFCSDYIMVFCIY